MTESEDRIEDPELEPVGNTAPGGGDVDHVGRDEVAPLAPLHVGLGEVET